MSKKRVHPTNGMYTKQNGCRVDIYDKDGSFIIGSDAHTDDVLRIFGFEQVCDVDVFDECADEIISNNSRAEKEDLIDSLKKHFSKYVDNNGKTNL